MRERVLAVVGAIAFIAVALLVRSALAGDDDAGAGDRPDRPSKGDLPVVACTPDLASVCAALVDAGAIAPADDDLDLAEAADPPAAVDGWITWSPAPAIANFDGGTGPSTWDPEGVLGSGDEALLLGPTERAALAASCGEVTWRCVAEAGGRDLTVGVGAPATAEGLARLLPIARALAPDDDYQQLDRRRLEAILDGPPGGQASAASMAVQRVTQPGAVAIVAGPAGVLERQARTTRGRDADLEVVTPTPGSPLAVVVSARTGRDLGSTDDWCEDAGDALTAVGVEPCTTEGVGDALAGLLWQVRERVG